MRRFLLLLFIPFLVLAQEEPDPDYSCMVSVDEEAGIISFDVPRCAVDLNNNGEIDDCSELLPCEGGFLCPVDRNDNLCTAGDVERPKKVCGNLSVFKSRSPMNFYDYQEWLRKYNLRCAGSDVLSCVGYQGDSFWKCGDTHGCKCPQGMTYNEQTRKCEANPQCPPNYVLENGICKARKALDDAGREWDWSICRAIENTGLIVDGKERVWCTVYPWQYRYGGSSYSLCDFTGNVWFRWYVDDDPWVYAYGCRERVCLDYWDYWDYTCDCWLLWYDTTGWTKEYTPSSGSRYFYSRGCFSISAYDETWNSPTYLEVKIELYKPLDTEPTYCPYEGSYYVPDKKICEARPQCPAKYAVGVDALERCRQCMSDTRSGLGINLPSGDEGEGNVSPPPVTESCIRFFTGQVRECRAGGTEVWGASCCGISGWFKNVCKNEEKALKKMREAGLCVYVGKYCSKRLKVLGAKICLEEKRAYCCFNSNLARIFQQCARSQLGISWGSGENPNCRGLTVEEFSSVDLSDPRCQQLFVEYVNTYLSRLDLNTSVSEALGRVQGWINSQMQDFVNYGREPKRGY